MRQLLIPFLVASCLAASDHRESTSDVGRCDSDALPATVHAVASGGAWHRDGLGGEYRLVVFDRGSEKPTSEVWLEWVATSEHPRADTVVDRVPVEEINGGSWRVDDPSAFWADSGVLFIVPATRGLDHPEEVLFEIRAGAIGEYEVGVPVPHTARLYDPEELQLLLWKWSRRDGAAVAALADSFCDFFIEEPADFLSEMTHHSDVFEEWLGALHFCFTDFAGFGTKRREWRKQAMLRRVADSYSAAPELATRLRRQLEETDIREIE